MCSISGFCFSASSHVNARNLATAMLCAGADRGTDACGASWLDECGSITTQTRATDPHRYTAKGMSLPKGTRTAVLHTRYATQGSPSNPLNNHPIQRSTASGDTLALVHNGCLDNDAALFSEYELTRNAQVDSEAIPALLADFDPDAWATTLSVIEGSMAIGWLDERTPGVLHLAKGLSSPLLLAYVQTPPGKKGKHPRIQGVIFASTHSMLNAGLATIGLTPNSRYVEIFSLRSGEYTSITEGVWDHLVRPFTVAKRYSTKDWNTPATSRFYGTPTGSKVTTLGTKGYTDYDLHMDYCTPVECEFYCDTACPARNVVGHSTDYTDDSDYTSWLSDNDIRQTVRAWAGQR